MRLGNSERNVILLPLFPSLFERTAKMKSLHALVFSLLFFLILTPVQAYDWGYLETEKYKVPYSHGVNNFDSMKGAGFIQAYHCPEELYRLYAQAWGVNSKYDGGGCPTGEWYDPQEGLDDLGWNDYLVAFLEIRTMADLSYRSMTFYEQRLISSFCEGINDAITTLRSSDPTYFENHIEKYIVGTPNYTGDFPAGIQPKHVLALYLYDFIHGDYLNTVIKKVSDSNWGPNASIYDNPNYFSMGSQMWAFIDASGHPLVQMDTHTTYLYGCHRPFVSEVTTDAQVGEVGINFFGWHLIGLPFMAVGVRYNQGENIPPMAWGFTAHNKDIVDIYHVNCYETDDAYMYQYWPGHPEYNTAITKRRPIVIQYDPSIGNQPASFEITEVYETPHHGPVIRFNSDKTQIYASRGCWDLWVGNFVRQSYGMLAAASIEDAIGVMQSCRAFPNGSYLFANGDPAPTQAKLRYQVAGPYPDRRSCFNHESQKASYSYWEPQQPGGPFIPG